jgi:hypothetical protein
MLFATNFLPVVAAYADTNQQTDTLTTNSVVSTQTISAKALTDHECNADEWHFVITQIDTAAHAPATITVNFANNNTEQVSLSKVTKGGVAHYSTTSNLDSTVTSATASIYTGWSGQFNLSHGPCADTTPVDTTITPPTLHTNVVCGADNDVTTLLDSVDSAHYTVSHVGNVYTITAKDGFTFSTGKTVTLNVPADADTTCDAVVIAIPATPSITDLCGTGNATWNVPSNTDQVKYILGSDGHLRVHTIFGFVFSDGSHSHDYGVAVETNTQSCDVCSNIKGIQTEVPEGKVLVDGKCKNVKVFVCKYVGTPGVNERLKLGKNPISVSVKSTGGTAVGSSFNDKQGRSFVLGVDDGIFNPTREDCPAPQGPTKVTPAVQFTEPTCETPTGRVTVTAMTGVTYKVNGTVITGTTSFAAGSSVTVTTELATGFVLASGAQGSFSHTFAAAPTDCVLGAVTGGRGGDVLGATTAQLANTGQSPWAAIIVGVTVISLTLTSAFASRRVRLDA